MTTPLCRPLAAFGYLYLAAQALGVWPGELLGSPLEPGGARGLQAVPEAAGMEGLPAGKSTHDIV